MGYSILAPCIFSLYLHPDDYARLTGVFDLIRAGCQAGADGQARAVECQAAGVGGAAGRKGSQAIPDREQGLDLRILSGFRRRGAGR